MASSSWNVDGTDEAPPPKRQCKCRPLRLAKVWESWSPDNPGRRFYNCEKSLIKDGGCKFFQWYDPEVVDHYKRLLTRLKASSTGAELKPVREELAEVQLMLKEAQQKYVLQKALRKTHNDKSAKKIADMQAEIKNIQTKVKVQWYVCVLLVMGMIGVGMGMFGVQ